MSFSSIVACNSPWIAVRSNSATNVRQQTPPNATATPVATQTQGAPTDRGRNIRTDGTEREVPDRKEGTDRNDSVPGFERTKYTRIRKNIHQKPRPPYGRNIRIRYNRYLH